MAKPKPPRDKPFILRVASFSNFNHTKEEADEVIDIVAHEYPKALPFVNTCSGDRLAVADWPIIVTGNPWLEEFIPPSKKDPGFKRIVAVRLKYVLGGTPATEKAFVAGLKWCDKNGIPALVTMMRFSRINMMYRYVEDPTKTYGDGGQFRARTNKQFTRAMALSMPDGKLEDKRKKRRVLKDMDKGTRFFLPYIPSWSQFKTHIRKSLFFVCDKKLRGCPWCQNCNWLTYGKRSFEGVNKGAFMPPWVPFQVNLRASRPRGGRISPKGNTHCHHDCPECFARSQLQQSGGIPSREISQNEKQRGATSHPFLREFAVTKAKVKVIDDLLAERKAGWPAGRPETPEGRPGLASTLFSVLPFLLPSPDTDTQWVDHAIDALDKYDDLWVPVTKDADSWLRGRMKNWSVKEKREAKRIRTATNKVLTKYSVKIHNNLAERFRTRFDKRTKKMDLDPVLMADLVREESALLRTLVNQLKAGDFGTVEAYVNHLKATAILLVHPDTVKSLRGKIPKARLQRMATRARKLARKVEKDVLRGI